MMVAQCYECTNTTDMVKMVNFMSCVCYNNTNLGVCGRAVATPGG